MGSLSVLRADAGAYDASATAGAAAPMVDIRGLSKHYFVRDTENGGAPRRIIALDKVDATIARGEFISLLGPSGCGKTTLLRIAAGLTQWAEGSISIGGQPVNGPRKDACMVFQHFGLLPWRSVIANVGFPLELDGVPARSATNAAWNCCNWSACPGTPRIIRMNYPAACSSGWRLPAR